MNFKTIIIIGAIILLIGGGIYAYNAMTKQQKITQQAKVDYAEVKDAPHCNQQMIQKAINNRETITCAVSTNSYLKCAPNGESKVSSCRPQTINPI